MNEALQAKLVEILASIQAAAKATGDFALAQLPDVVQSYVLYGRVSLTIYMALAVALLASAVYAAQRLRTEARKEECEEVVIGLCVFGGAAAGIVGLIMLLVNLNAALLVWFAPKVWLLHGLAGLVK